MAFTRSSNEIVIVLLLKSMMKDVGLEGVSLATKEVAGMAFDCEILSRRLPSTSVIASGSEAR